MDTHSPFTRLLIRLSALGAIDCRIAIVHPLYNAPASHFQQSVAFKRMRQVMTAADIAAYIGAAAWLPRVIAADWRLDL